MNPTTDESIWNGELIGNVFFVERAGTLQSFTFHHEEDHKGGCRLDFIVLSRDKEPEMDGRNFWNVEEVFTDLIVGKNSTNSGAMQVALEPGSFYSTAVHADSCTGRDGLYYPVQTNRDGPTDVGVGETIGYVRGEKQVEADGSTYQESKNSTRNTQAPTEPLCTSLSSDPRKTTAAPQQKAQSPHFRWRVVAIALRKAVRQSH